MKKLLLFVMIANLLLAGCKKDKEEPALAVDKTSLSYTSAGQALALGVTSNTKWTTTVSSGAEWLTLNQASGEGNKEITATAATNATTTARTATISIKAGDLSKTVNVTQAAAEAALSVELATLTFAKGGEAKTIAVTSNSNWTATVSAGATWLTLANASGSGNGTVTATATANTTTSQRTANITVAIGSLTKTVNVTQATGDATLVVSTEALSFTKDNEVKTIAVASNEKWTVSMESKQGAGWLKFSATSGTGNGTFTVTSGANSTTATRTAIITITAGSLSQTVAVTQAASEATLNVAPAVLNFAKGGEGKSITVTSNSGWTAAVSAGATWLTLSAASGNGDGTLTATATANTTTAPRVATITFQGGVISRIGETVTVTQAAGDAFVNISTDNFEYSNTGGNGYVTVTSNTTWTVTKDVDWVSINTTSGNGNGSFTITATNNSTMDAREGRVTVGGKIIAIKQNTLGITFRDAKFKAALIKGGGCDTNGDGVISLAEAKAATVVSVNGQGIMFMDELSYFVNIVDLSCFDNQLASLNLSNNKDLKRIYCSNNLLTSLNVSANTKLTVLSCGTNQISELNVNNNTELVEFRCNNNKIQGAMTLINNTKIFVMDARNNSSLTTIRVWLLFMEADHPQWYKDPGARYNNM